LICVCGLIGEIEMIRFIDLRGQGTTYKFAFWDTTKDKFCEFFDSQAWESIDDFKEAFELDGGRFSDGVRISGIERFLDLIPEWVENS
jgi:hypothetical protein